MQLWPITGSLRGCRSSALKARWRLSRRALNRDQVDEDVADRERRERAGAAAVAAPPFAERDERLQQKGDNLRAAHQLRPALAQVEHGLAERLARRLAQAAGGEDDLAAAERDLHGGFLAEAPIEAPEAEEIEEVAEAGHAPARAHGVAVDRSVGVADGDDRTVGGQAFEDLVRCARERGRAEDANPWSAECDLEETSGGARDEREAGGHVVHHGLPGLRAILHSTRISLAPLRAQPRHSICTLIARARSARSAPSRRLLAS